MRLNRRALLVGGISAVALGGLVGLTRKPAPPDYPEKPGYSSADGRREVAVLQPGKKTKVFFVLGQSNAISIVDDTSFVPAPGTENYNFYDGRNYEARDPLLGPQTAGRSINGIPGSSWATRLGSKFIERGLSERSVLINASVGASSMADWSKGLLREKTQSALQSVQNAGLEIDYILQHQGESDVGTTPSVYAAQCREVAEIFRHGGCAAPYFVSLASWYKGSVHDEVREGQILACSSKLGLYQGPDIDALIGPEFRQIDDLHLSSKGLDATAEAWLNILREYDGEAA